MCQRSKKATSITNLTTAVNRLPEACAPDDSWLGSGKLHLQSARIVAVHEFSGARALSALTLPQQLPGARREGFRGTRWATSSSRPPPVLTPHSSSTQALPPTSRSTHHSITDAPLRRRRNRVSRRPDIRCLPACLASICPAHPCLSPPRHPSPRPHSIVVRM